MAWPPRRSLPAGRACGYDPHLVRRPVRRRDLSGDWLSRLERAVHIREVTGSNPVSPTIFRCQRSCPRSRHARRRSCVRADNMRVLRVEAPGSSPGGFFVPTSARRWRAVAVALLAQRVGPKWRNCRQQTVVADCRASSALRPHLARSGPRPASRQRARIIPESCLGQPLTGHTSPWVEVAPILGNACSAREFAVQVRPGRVPAERS